MKSFKYALILLFFVIISCVPQDKSDFNEASLKQAVYDKEMNASTVGDVLEAHKGEKVMIVVWASWCIDCIKSLPNVAQFQKDYPEVNFVFLSVDEEEEKWQMGLEKYMNKFKIEGEQYYFDTGWSKNVDNDFVDYIGLDWIPRYMLLDEKGKIAVYYAKKINANSIKKQLEN
ncbi:TlpA family protein disulfide reductase [Weeksellaceae bacterium KMM 9724]|uniref:TlpA family protein disulfide reductase n=1 Tax=Profundicola chukchiensis TaxID=2961959 RepID=UPI0024398CCB|nr:TlpA disulfide reductase family protein [Profundicola chukchiensis]MDG4949560.1 TlpA family protein disulfide reductase [Profundicola chukchiensis]